MRIDNLDISGGVTVRLYAMDNGPNEYLTVVLEDGTVLMISKDGTVEYEHAGLRLMFNVHNMAEYEQPYN